jgi:hypothetical protein
MMSQSFGYVADSGRREGIRGRDNRERGFNSPITKQWESKE